MDVSESLLTSAEVAAYLHVSEATLSRWRASNDGPTWINLSGIYRYRRADLDAWITDQRVTE